LELHQLQGKEEDLDEDGLDSRHGRGIKDQYSSGKSLSTRPFSHNRLPPSNDLPQKPSKHALNITVIRAFFLLTAATQ